jgi:hypothetical protein
MGDSILNKIIKFLNYPLRKKGSNGRYTVCLITRVNISIYGDDNIIGKFYRKFYNLD